MKHAVVVVSVVGILLSVVPGFAMDGDNGTEQFTALVGVQASAEMTDQELAAVEGQGAPFLGAGQIGLVSAAALLNISKNDIDVRVIRDITVQDVNVAVLSAGRQR